MEIIRQRLKELREEKGLTVYALSKQIGIANQVIYQWERGESLPTPESIVKICKFFNCTADFLLGLADE